MKVVYYPYTITELKGMGVLEDGKSTGLVHFGVIEGDDSYYEQKNRWLVEKYESRDFRSINGIPFEDFKPDERWKPLPKGWTYNTPLFEEGLIPEWDTFKKRCEGLSIQNPSDILLLIKEGWLVRKEPELERVEAEIDHKKYRLVKKYPHWETTYTKDKSTYIWLPDGAFYDSYKDAMLACEMSIQDYYEAVRQERLIDREMAIQWVLEKVPAECRDNVETILLGLPLNRGFVLRYYENKVLWQSPDKQWLEVYDCSNKQR
jgi:hypothetical protein